MSSVRSTPNGKASAVGLRMDELTPPPAKREAPDQGGPRFRLRKLQCFPSAASDADEAGCKGDMIGSWCSATLNVVGTELLAVNVIELTWVGKTLHQVLPIGSFNLLKGSYRGRCLKLYTV